MSDDLYNELIYRTKHDWQEYAKEPVVVEQIGGALYGFGTELACFRIYYKYRHAVHKARVIFSEPRQSWAFVLETKN